MYRQGSKRPQSPLIPPSQAHAAPLLDGGAARVYVSLQPLQVRSQVRGGLVAQLAVFLQRPLDDLSQLGRQVAIQTQGRDRRLAEDGVEDDCRSIPWESPLTRGHFVQHRAEAEQVRARVELFSTRLLRRHV